MKKSERDKITKTQLKVLKLINKGYNSDQIAVALHIQPSTVAVHRKNLYERLDVHNVWEVVNYCRKHNVR